MVYGSTRDGHAVCDGNGFFKVQSFGGNMSLVVVEG